MVTSILWRIEVYLDGVLIRVHCVPNANASRVYVAQVEALGFITKVVH